MSKGCLSRDVLKLLFSQQTGSAVLYQIVSISFQILDALHIPGGAADTNDGDGRAGNADLGGDAAKNNAEQAQQERSDRVAGRLNTVAALERTDIALTDSNGRGRRGGRDGNGLSRVVQDHRRGDRKEGESQCSSGSGELHLWFGSVL